MPLTGRIIDRIAREPIMTPHSCDFQGAPPQPPHVQTKREIEDMLGCLGMTPRKRFGQNFLIDGNLMRRLVQSAGLTKNDFVIEVGAGTGGLTDLLARFAGRVVCVEIDRGLQQFLDDRFDEADHVRIVRGDVLAGKHGLNAELQAVLADHPPESPGGVKLVANLPYQIATPLIMNLLVDYPIVSRMCFTVQAEVGERIVAPPGGKTYGPLAIVTQTLARVETVCRIGPAAFWPRPKVDSSMMRIEVGGGPLTSIEQAREFSSLVRRAFDHRRKTLRSSLGYFLDVEQLARAGEIVDLKLRPQAISVAEWQALFQSVEGLT